MFTNVELVRQSWKVSKAALSRREPTPYRVTICHSTTAPHFLLNFFHNNTLFSSHILVQKNAYVMCQQCGNVFFLHIFYNITYIHFTFIQSYIRRHLLGPLHLLIAWKLNGKTHPVVPSRESNSGLPYSKPTPTLKLHNSRYAVCNSQYLYLQDEIDQ